MKSYAIAYGVSAVVFLAIDAVWLSTMASRLYRPLLGDMLAEDFNITAAAAFYLLYIFGIVFFAVRPALDGGSWGTAALAGALLGLVAYGTYDLTNHATLKGWPLAITLADLCWGTVLTAASATAGYAAARYFGS